MKNCRRNGVIDMIIYVLWELHNGVEPRIKTAYTSKRKALKKLGEWSNRPSEHNYYMRELEVIE